MKKPKYIILFVLFLLFLTGCSDENLVRWEKEATNIQATAVHDAKQLRIVTKEEIREGIDYLKEHLLNPIQDREDAKKIIYYSTYLYEIGNANKLTQNHFLTQVSHQIQLYIVDLYQQDVKKTPYFLFTRGVQLKSMLLSITDEEVNSFVKFFK